MIKYLSHFILVVTFFVCNTFAWAETNVAEKYGCKNLHEIQSGEDALQQLYDNLNTDCFAKIPEMELEKVWGIKVYDIAKTKKMNNEEFSKYSNDKPTFKGKMADKLVAELADKNIAQLKLRIVAMHDKYRLNTTTIYNIFPYADRFPENLPAPTIVYDPRNRTSQRIHYQWINFSNYGVYSPKCDYFWESSDRNKKLSLEVSFPDDKYSSDGNISAFEFYINAD